MTLFSDLIQRASTAVSDPTHATWTTAELAQYLNDAIRAYSDQFPRTAVTTHPITASQITLPADFTGLLRVQVDGIDVDPNTGYTLTHTADATTPSTLNLAIEPDQPTAVITYHATHALIADTTAVSGSSTVPTHHEHLLIKYMLWQATLAQQMREQQDPTSNSSLIMSQYASNARRLRTDYEVAMAQAVYASDGSSRVVSWHTASGGNIYP